MGSPLKSLRWRLPFLSLVLLVSGACALVYQTAWLREFRLIFGGATPATAAVLAVFMGGLGAGGAWWGRRAEGTNDLLRLYAWIELGVGVTAAVTPFLLDGVRALYVRTGGAMALGGFGATVAHLVLTVVVLGVPCFLLGGNLPPAVKWIETDDDPQRGSLGVAYGCNAFGAVLGVLWSTFWALEHLGTRQTLWWAAGLNVALGVVAWLVALGPGRSQREGTADNARTKRAAEEQKRSEPRLPQAPPRFVYAAAAVTGFTFFLAELVWYRLLTPLLGGTVYCFGLILAQALLGLALGGWLYRAWVAPVRGRTHLETLAGLASAQALALAVPWALGDRLAVLAFHLQEWRNLGFGGLVSGWSVTVGAMVLIPSVLAGAQFPMLVGLLGEGRREAARQVGNAYAANTGGAIVGSLVGGFVLLPWLTAPGCWQLVTAMTLGLAVAALAVAARPVRWVPWVLTVVAGLGVAAAMLGEPGPTGAWRHSAIGYRVLNKLPEEPAGLEELLRQHRRRVVREYEGRESSIAVVAGEEGWGLFSNGKADGSALRDAGTQIMLGLIGALEHPRPASALVIGLGTGTSAGWLASVPGMAHVDVVELEPRVVDVAREYFGAVNRDALARTNLQVIVADAREVLLARGRTYDLIASEPPNPYRAGVASLFTVEFYEAVRRRLAPGGLFCQWLQAYQLSSESVQILYATLLAVFPHVETWTLGSGDLLFVGHLEEPAYPLARLRERLVDPVYREALERAWLANSVEGLLAHYFAGSATARRAAAGAEASNRDDRNLLEFGLARSQQRAGTFRYHELLAAARQAGDAVPAHFAVEIDAGRLLEARMLMFASRGETFEIPADTPPESMDRAQAIQAAANGDDVNTLGRWRGAATSPAEQLMLINAVARAGNPDAGRTMLGWVQESWPVDARIAAAWLAWRHSAPEAAIDHIEAALREGERVPWISSTAVRSMAALMTELIAAQPASAPRLFEAWRRPTVSGLWGRSRPGLLGRLGPHLPTAAQLDLLDILGPHFPWDRGFLEFRAAALDAAGRTEAASARGDLKAYMRQTGQSFGEKLTLSNGQSPGVTSERVTARSGGRTGVEGATSGGR